MIGVALASAVDASALTASDLDGKYYGAFMRGMRHEATFPKEQFGGKFEMRDGTLYMLDFWRAYDIPVTVGSNYITFPSGRYSDNGNGVWSNSTMRLTTAKGYSYNGGYYIDYGYASSGGQVRIYLASTSLDCDYCFQTDNQAVNMSIYQNGQEIFSDGNGLEVYVFDTNTKVTEYTGSEITDTYDVGITIDSSDPTKAKIRNWGAWGINFKNTVSSSGNTYSIYYLDATIDYDRETFTIPRQVIGGGVDENDAEYLGHGYLHGYTANWYRWYGDLTPVDYYAASGSSGSGNDIVGKIVPRAPEHRYVEDNYWHKTCGGQLETWCGMDIDFGPMQTWCASWTPNTMVSVERTVYETPYQYEYTHDVRLQASQLAASDTQLFVKGKILQPENDRHVVSYDLYVVPGHHETINTLAGTDDTHGAKGAQVVVSGLKTDESGSASFGYYDVLPDGLEIRPDRKYSLFVRANYDPDLHLNPTFHSLTSGGGISTGIDTITDDIDEIRVAAVPGGIHIEGFEGTAEVYTASGVQVFGGTVAGIISVNPGLYIVRAGKKSVKVRIN